MNQKLVDVELFSVDPDLAKRLNERDEYQVFIPENLKNFERSKKIVFRNKNLKTSNVFDLINNLIFKYYTKNELEFALYSKILKENYGKNYNYYIDFLVERRILILTKNHSVGNHSRIYMLNPDMIKSINRSVIRDKKLITKNAVKYFENIYMNKSEDSIPVYLRKKLADFIECIELDEDKTYEYLEILKNTADNEVYQKNLFAVESILSRELFTHFDDYGRMHTNFTILKSEIRKNYLTIDGEELSEIDIPNSQPYFLYKYISNNNIKVDSEEHQLFGDLTRKGEFYNYIMDKMSLTSKSDAKDLIFKVFFGKNSMNKMEDRQFSLLFPSIYSYINNFKKSSGNYKEFSYVMQRLESELIYRKIVKDLIKNIPDIKLFTVHDSIVYPSKYDKEVKNIFYSHLYEL